MEDLLARAGTGRLICDTTWTVTETTVPVSRLLGFEESADSIDGRPLDAVLPGDLAQRVRDGLADGQQPVTVEEYLPGTQRWIELRAVGNDRRTLVEVRDVTQWVERVTELERAETNLSLLRRLVGLVSELLGAVVTATTPETLQESVVSRLAATDLFELAWVGDWSADREDLTVQAADGAEAVLDAIQTADNPGLEQRALDAGEPELRRELASDGSIPEGIRKTAFTHGVQAGIAVPLTYGETTFGVLGLYTARPEVLDEPGVAGIETIGAVVGFVLHATRQRQAMDTATKRELAFEVGPAAGPLARIAGEVGCELTLEGTANVDTEVVLAYVSVDGVDAATVTELAAEDAAVERARTVQDLSEGGVCELRLRSDSPLVRLVALGATVRSATWDEAGGRITADVAPQADVRGLLDRLTEVVDDVELRGTQTRERPARTTAAVEKVLDEGLTDRQRVALRTAYEAGYFASPRHSNSAEVATSLGITAPTLSHHLRVAQRKLLSACFD